MMGLWRLYICYKERQAFHTCIADVMVRDPYTLIQGGIHVKLTIIIKKKIPITTESIPGKLHFAPRMPDASNQYSYKCLLFLLKTHP